MKASRFVSAAACFSVALIVLLIRFSFISGNIKIGPANKIPEIYNFHSKKKLQGKVDALCVIDASRFEEENRKSITCQEPLKWMSLNSEKPDLDTPLQSGDTGNAIINLQRAGDKGIPTPPVLPGTIIIDEDIREQ